MLPQVYSDVQYGIHTIEVQAMSDTATVAIEQSGEVLMCGLCRILIMLPVVLLVEANIEVINGTSISLHIQSSKPATYNCRLNDEDYFPCELFILLTNSTQVVVFVGDDQFVIRDLARGNYTLTVEATATDDSSQLAYTVIGPVLVFGSGIINGQSAASMCLIIL